MYSLFALWSFPPRSPSFLIDFLLTKKNTRCLNRKRPKNNRNRRCMGLLDMMSKNSEKGSHLGIPGWFFFTKQLGCASLEKKRNQCEQVLDPFFWIVGPIIKKTHATPVPIVLMSFLSRKPLHRLFRLFFCLFLFKHPVSYHSSLNYWWVFH